MNKPRVVFIKNSMKSYGGLEKYTLALLRRFIEKGCFVTLLTTDWKDEIDPKRHYDVVSFGKKKCFSLLHLLCFQKNCATFLKNHPHDVVFGIDRSLFSQTHHRAGNGVHAAYLDERRKTSSFFKRCSFLINPLHRLQLLMEKRTFCSKELQVLFTNSFMVKEEVCRYYPAVDPKKVCVVHNGIAWDDFLKVSEEALEKKPLLIQEYGLNPDAYQFLFIGNEYKRKGLCILFDALEQLQEEQFELSIIGKERDIGYFQEYAKKCKIEKKVHFFGQRKDVIPFYQIADCLVIPSLYDPSANVTVEALSLGVRVISSTKNGGHEIIQKDTGWVYKDVPGLIASIKEALLHKKTKESQHTIRESVRHLDLQSQLDKIVDATLETY